MKLTVLELGRNGDVRTELAISLSSSIGEVKQQLAVCRPQYADVAQQHLYFDGKELRDSSKIGIDLGILQAKDALFLLSYRPRDSATPSSHSGHIRLAGASYWPPELVKALESANAAFAGGVPPQLTREGEGGTYFIPADTAHQSGCEDGRSGHRDYYDEEESPEYVACFKPRDEEQNAPNNPKRCVGAFGTPSLRVGVLSGEAYMREVIAYMLDHGGLAGVPATGLVEGWHEAFNNPIASFPSSNSTAGTPFFDVKHPRSVAGSSSLDLLAAPAAGSSGGRLTPDSLDASDGNRLRSVSAESTELSIGSRPAQLKSTHSGFTVLSPPLPPLTDAINVTTPAASPPASTPHEGLRSPRPILRKLGSFQLFVKDAVCSDEFGCGKFPVEEVQKIALLDIRLLNLDRNGENILVRFVSDPDATSASASASSGGGGGGRPPKRIELTPIDHGMILPSDLGVGACDWIWMSWPQVKKPLSEKLRAYVLALDVEADIAKLKSAFGTRLRPQCLTTLRITHAVLRRGVEAGMTLFDIASVLCRNDEDLNEQSVIEKMVNTASMRASSDTHNMRLREAGHSRLASAPNTDAPLTTPLESSSLKKSDEDSAALSGSFASLMAGGGTVLSSPADAATDASVAAGTVHASTPAAGASSSSSSAGTSTSSSPVAGGDNDTAAPTGSTTFAASSGSLSGSGEKGVLAITTERGSGRSVSNGSASADPSPLRHSACGSVWKPDVDVAHGTGTGSGGGTGAMSGDVMSGDSLLHSGPPSRSVSNPLPLDAETRTLQAYWLPAGMVSLPATEYSGPPIGVVAQSVASSAARSLSASFKLQRPRILTRRLPQLLDLLKLDPHSELLSAIDDLVVGLVTTNDTSLIRSGSDAVFNQPAPSPPQLQFRAAASPIVPSFVDSDLHKVLPEGMRRALQAASKLQSSKESGLRPTALTWSHYFGYSDQPTAVLGITIGLAWRGRVACITAVPRGKGVALITPEEVLGGLAVSISAALTMVSRSLYGGGGGEAATAPADREATLAMIQHAAASESAILNACAVLGSSSGGGSGGSGGPPSLPLLASASMFESPSAGTGSSLSASGGHPTHATVTRLRGGGTGSHGARVISSPYTLAPARMNQTWSRFASAETEPEDVTSLSSETVSTTTPSAPISTRGVEEGETPPALPVLHIKAHSGVPPPPQTRLDKLTKSQLALRRATSSLAAGHSLTEGSVFTFSPAAEAASTGTATTGTAGVVPPVASIGAFKSTAGFTLPPCAESSPLVDSPSPSDLPSVELMVLAHGPDSLNLDCSTRSLAPEALTDLVAFAHKYGTSLGASCLRYGNNLENDKVSASAACISVSRCRPEAFGAVLHARDPLRLFHLPEVPLQACGNALESSVGPEGLGSSPSTAVPGGGGGGGGGASVSALAVATGDALLHKTGPLSPAFEFNEAATLVPHTPDSGITTPRTHSDSSVGIGLGLDHTPPAATVTALPPGVAGSPLAALTAVMGGGAAFNPALPLYMLGQGVKPTLSAPTALFAMPGLARVGKVDANSSGNIARTVSDGPVGSGAKAPDLRLAALKRSLLEPPAASGTGTGTTTSSSSGSEHAPSSLGMLRTSSYSASISHLHAADQRRQRMTNLPDTQGTAVTSTTHSPTASAGGSAHHSLHIEAGNGSNSNSGNGGGGMGGGSVNHQSLQFPLRRMVSAGPVPPDIHTSASSSHLPNVANEPFVNLHVSVPQVAGEFPSPHHHPHAHLTDAPSQKHDTTRHSGQAHGHHGHLGGGPQGGVDIPTFEAMFLQHFQRLFDEHKSKWALGHKHSHTL